MATLERPREAESSTYVTSLGPAPSLPAFPSDLVHPRRPSQSAGPLTNGAIGGQELEEAVSNGLEIPALASSLETARNAFLGALYRLLSPGQALPPTADLMDSLLDHLKAAHSTSEMVERASDSDADELQARLSSLSSTDTSHAMQLARTLGDLVSCLDRLRALTPSSAPSSRPASAHITSTPPLDEVTMFEQLSRDAHALRTSDLGEVAQAEQAILWNRVDSLLETVASQCRQQDRLPSYEDEDAPEYDFPDDATISSPRLKTSKGAGQPPPTEEKMAADLDTVSEAIERLYFVSPQLANQRVDPARRTALREVQLAKLGAAIERLSKGRLEDQRADVPILEPPPTKAVNLGKARAIELDRIIESIDKAASRTLADQRVSISARQRAVLVEARRTAKEVSAELEREGVAEAARRRIILDKTGSGRLTSQDATFSQVPQQLSNYRFGAAPPPSPPMRGDMKRSLSQQRDRAKSLPALAPASAVRKRFSVSSLLARRPSTEAAASQAEAVLRYVAQEQRNLCIVTVRIFPLGFTYSSLDPTNDRLILRHDATGGLVPVRLPCRATDQTPAVSIHSDHIEIKLRTSDAANTTRSRPDLEVSMPMQANEMRKLPPAAFLCSEPTCGSLIVKAGPGMRYTPLPSEHWAELLDAWMCHADQQLTDEVGKHAREGGAIWPKSEEEVCVGSSYLLWSAKEDDGWRATLDDQGKIGNDGTVWHTATCSACGVSIGQAAAASGGRGLRAVRLRKHAIRPWSPDGDQPIYSLSMHVSAQLLEISQAHAVHRFVLEDELTQVPRLLIWIFNPSVRISYSMPDDSSNGFTADDDHLASSTSTLALSVFYRILDGDGHEARLEAFIREAGGESHIERVGFPARVLERTSRGLKASTALQPPSCRKVGTLDVGLLERL